MLTGESEARARIERAAAQAEDNLRRARRMNGELAEVRSVGHSRGGGAEVTVSASGVLVDLHVTAKLAQRPAEEIRAAILQANAEACSQAQQQVREVSGRWLGEMRAHASHLDDIAETATEGVDAGRAVSIHGDAFGPLCAFIGEALEPVQSVSRLRQGGGRRRVRHRRRRPRPGRHLRLDR